VSARPGIRDLLFALMDTSRSAREGETTLSPKRRNALPPAAAKEGVRGGTMGSPTRTRYRGIVDAVCDLAGVAV
jgi:hypothetical protein